VSEVVAGRYELAADLTAGELRGVHVRVADAVLDGGDDGVEVAGIEALCRRASPPPAVRQ